MGVRRRSLSRLLRSYLRQHVHRSVHSRSDERRPFRRCLVPGQLGSLPDPVSGRRGRCRDVGRVWCRHVARSPLRRTPRSSGRVRLRTGDLQLCSQLAGRTVTDGGSHLHRIHNGRRISTSGDRRVRVLRTASDAAEVEAASHQFHHVQATADRKTLGYLLRRHHHSGLHKLLAAVLVLSGRSAITL